MRFESHGIHTRLYYIVKRAGGIDMDMRKNYLMRDFGLDEETVDLVINYDVENLLKEKDIKEIRQMIEDKNSRDKEKSKRAFMALEQMLRFTACRSNMLNFPWW